MKTSKILLGIAASALMASCKPDLKTDTPSANGVDFSTYVALGNSLTAGYADNSLYRSGQENSYPSMLAGQFSQVGGGSFKQPLLPGEAGWPDRRLVLRNIPGCNGIASLSPTLYDNPLDTSGSGVNIGSQGPFNNVGVPGIKVTHYLINGYGNFNPYAKRFFANLSGNALMEAQRLPATFFTMWLGSNDVLFYATSGGEGGIGGSILNLNNISDSVDFRIAYDSIVNSMTRNGAKGALINIPDVTSIPFFTTIPSNGLVLNATQAAALNSQYQSLGITFSEGANGFVIRDAAAPGGIRKAKPGEYILLNTPQDSMRCYGLGSFVPLGKQYVLTEDEVALIKAFTSQYNEVIRLNAQKHNLAYVDMNSYLKTIAAGIQFSGVDINTSFVSGGAFSLDGVHLTPRGYALAANEIIRAVNAHYGSSVPAVDIARYEGIRFP